MKTKTLSPFLVVIFVLLSGENLFGQTLLVAAASSMKDVLEEATTEFERQSGYKVHFTFGSSGLLAHEIEGGVPYDIYIAAGEDFIQGLYHRKLLVSGSSKIICRGRLVIIVRKDSARKIGRLHEIVNFPLIAIANPQHAPYGRAAREALQNAGVWLGLQNRLLYTERVADVLELVETGKVPVGIGAQSLRAEAHLEYIPVEERLYTPPEAHIAVVRGAAHKEAVKALVDFLASEKGKAILKGYGFSVP